MSLDPLSLLFVFTSGVFALFSPCGFPMLPGYVSYYIGTNASLGKAFPGGVACTLGLVTVFSIIGVIADALGSLITYYISLLELVAGLATIFLGLSMILKIRIPMFSIPVKAPKRRGLIGIYLYGVTYGMATLACSAPIFFSILSIAIAAGGLLNGILTFTVYAIGMGLPLIIITILLVNTKKMFLKRIMKMMPWIEKLSGIILVSIGVYLIYFYLYL